MLVLPQGIGDSLFPLQGSCIISSDHGARKEKEAIVCGWQLLQFYKNWWSFINHHSNFYTPCPQWAFFPTTFGLLLIFLFTFLRDILPPIPAAPWPRRVCPSYAAQCTGWAWFSKWTAFSFRFSTFSHTTTHCPSLHCVTSRTVLFCQHNQDSRHRRYKESLGNSAAPKA